MDPDEQPSTSKKYLSKVRANKPEPKAMYPATFEQFKKYTKVEEYVIKEMKNAGPDIFKINYKIRHKYYPIVYKKFYSNEATRKQMFQNGFELKPMPKFLKDKLMMMPTDDVELTVDDKSKSNKGTSSLAKRIEQINKDRSPTSEKENCPTKVLKSPTKDTPKSGRPKEKQLNVEMRKITTFFSALKSSGSKVSEPDVRKRKNDLRSSSAEPRVKRLRNAAQKNKTNSKTISEDKGKPQPKGADTAKLNKFSSDLITDDGSSNIQIMVEVPGPINTELYSEMITPKLLTAKEPSRKVEPTNNHRITGKTNRNKRKATKSQHRNRGVPTIYSSDDSDIDSSNMIDDPGSLDSDVVRVCEDICLIPEMSPLPRRNRMENYEPHSLSPPKKILQNDADEGMSLLNLSRLSCPTFNLSSVVGVEGVAEFEGNVAAKGIEFPREDFICVDRLEAIRTHSAKVRAYIKHLLNLEIEKTREKTSQLSSRSKVVSAFLQMSFDEYKCLVNANKLLHYGKLADNVTTSLKKQYDAIMNKKKPWLNGVYVKLPTLISFLQSKGISQPIQLQHIPPRILSFIDVMANTNLKESVSLSRDKPPDSYKLLLHLCKKEYRKCCEDGIWSDGVHFNDSSDVIGAESVPLLNVHTSGGEVNAGVCCEEAQSAVQTKECLQLEQEPYTLTVNPQMVEGKSEQSDNSKPNPRLKKKKNRIINSFQNDQVIEDYLDAMFQDSDCKSEATQCPDITDHDSPAVPPKLVTDIGKPTEPNKDPAIAAVPTEALILSSPKRSVGPEVITEATNIATFSGNLLPLKESEEEVEDVNVPAETVAPAKVAPPSEILAPEPLPALSEESVGIPIDDTPDSAGELLSDIIHPKHSQNKSAYLIPPSPNLFQSSGKSQINCTQSQDINAQPTETVYVPCKNSLIYNMTDNTEQNNFTVCVVPTSDSEDPFVETINNQEENMRTQVPSLDPGLVVKQELICQRDVPNKACNCSPDDSVEIIEIPPPEPYVIEDSPDMTSLLNIQTSLATNESGTTVNQLHLNNEHFEPLIAQAVTVETTVEEMPTAFESELPETKVFMPLPQNIVVSSQHIVPEEDASDCTDSVEIIDILPSEPIVIDDEETAPELLDMLLRRPPKTTYPNREVVNVNPCDPSFSCLDNFPQAQQFPSHLSFTQSQSNVQQNAQIDVFSSPLRGGPQNGEENVASPEVETDLGVVSSAGIDEQFQKEGNDISINATEEILPSGSSESVSHVSIAPQNFPSDVDFTQSGSNYSSMKAYGRGASQTVNHESDDEKSTVFVYVALSSDDTKETSKGDQPLVASAMNIECSEAKIPVDAGSGDDVPDNRTIHVDSSTNLEETASNGIQKQNLYSQAPLNRDILQALELATYCEEEISSVAHEGRRSAKDHDAYILSEGELLDVDEKETHFKEASRENQILEKPQEICVSVDQLKEDSEDLDRQESGHCPDQLRNVKSVETIQQFDIYVDATTTNATSASRTEYADESEVVEPARASLDVTDKAPVFDQQNPSLSMEVELPQHAEDCENPAPSLNKTDTYTKHLPEAERYESLPAEDSTSEYQPPKVIAFADDLQDADAPPKVVANVFTEVEEDVDVVTTYLPEAERYQFQHPEDKTKEDEPPRSVTNEFVDCLQETSSCKQTQQSHVPYIASVESRVLHENAHAITAFENHLQNVRISRGTHRRHPKNDVEKDVIAISSGCNNQETVFSEQTLQTGQSQQTHLFAGKSTSKESRNRTEFEETKTANWHDAGPITDDSKNVMLSNASECSLPDEVFAFATQHIEAMEINNEDGATNTFCDICPLVDYFEVTVATTVDQHSSSAANSQNSGPNLESASTAMDKSCVSQTLQDSSHAMLTPAAIEHDPQIPVSSTAITNIISPSSSNSSAKLQPTLGFVASKSGKATVFNQITSNVAQQTESSIVSQVIATEVTNAAKPATQKTHTFPALLPIGIISNDRPDEIIEGEAVLDDADEEVVVVPFLIKGRFLKSFPFKMLSQTQVQLHWEQSQFLGIEVKFETNLNDNVDTFVEPVEVAVEKEAIIQNSEVTALPLKKTQIKAHAPETKDPKVCRISAAKKMSLRNQQSLQKSDISSTLSVSESTAPSRSRTQSMLPKVVRVERESKISAQPKFTQPPPKRKPSPTSKKKATPKKFTKKPDLELVPQKVHSFRSLPMGAVKKTPSSEILTTRVPLTTVEEIDFFIEDASQVIACSNTASQLLATDCTYFENSKLLNNIDEYCALQPSTSKPPAPERTNPKVNTLNPPTILSDGITARKVWKVHLQWMTQRKNIVETRFITGGRWLSSYDESARLMFNFSPITWSHIFRVLKEIDQYEYRRMAAKERKHCPVVTPLHRVLRFLFDTAPQIVNVRLTNDIHSPFTMCEKSTPVYRKPFQCLTKGIPACVLNRMQALKRDLRAANPDE